jgi:hypothetical protein
VESVGGSLVGFLFPGDLAYRYVGLLLGAPNTFVAFHVESVLATRGRTRSFFYWINRGAPNPGGLGSNALLRVPEPFGVHTTSEPGNATIVHCAGRPE